MGLGEEISHERVREVAEEGSYVSDVFLGYRQVPHLIIAIRIGDREVRLQDVSCPVLNIYAMQDHLVPPAASKANLASSAVASCLSRGRNSSC